MAEALDLRAYEVGRDVPKGVCAKVLALFNAHYHRYHYLEKMLATDRIRITASVADEICGFCTVEPTNGYGVLSNLLVSSAKRGSGIGGLMEDVRFQICRGENLVAYSSCVTLGLQSQRLKVRRGMIPINVKFGYRHDVFEPDHVSSAVTFLASAPLPAQPTANTTKVDAKTRRIRLIARDARFLDDALRDLESENEHYIDVMVAPDLREQMLAERGLVFHGLDVLSSDRVWGYLWQVPNDVYRAGVAAKNDLILPVEEICSGVRARFCVPIQAA